ncbi:MAG: agmatinase family protein [Elusimicrobiota bacterium]|nr:agmatinase family protein [Elusimicrobiota bacterium]
MLDFDPNAPADDDGGIFGLPHQEKDAALVLLPVPWEVTTSYGGGTSKGPAAILAASGQIDLFDASVHKPYEPGLYMRPESKEVRAWNKAGKAAAQKVIKAGGVADTPALKKALAQANALSEKLNAWVKKESLSLMRAGKIVGVVGGDHSVPLGAFQAAAEVHGAFGLLHFDAHSDTRDAYEGFVHSHASIMRNALDSTPRISKLVQVGIRDFCEEEQSYMDAQGPRARMFTDRWLNERRFSGRSWDELCKEIVAELPDKVWVTFDIDGLDPKLCPHTGTPVPGGLELAQAEHLIAAVARSGRTILGFDLVEVAPAPGGKDEWDANVGMRLLYKLAAWTLVSRGLRKTRG